MQKKLYPLIIVPICLAYYLFGSKSLDTTLDQNKPISITKISPSYIEDPKLALETIQEEHASKIESQEDTNELASKSNSIPEQDPYQALRERGDDAITNTETSTYIESTVKLERSPEAENASSQNEEKNNPYLRLKETGQQREVDTTEYVNSVAALDSN